MSGLTFTFSAIEGGALRHWDLRGPNGMVRFETVDALGFKTASVYVHERVAPAGGELEDCELCGKCWRNALLGIGARSLRAEWEAAGDDEIIREALERWYHEELSSPVPVSEGSQVSGEVGPASGVVAGSNQIAATGAGNGGVVPVPVAAHHQTAGWGGGPGECGVECVCGWTFDHFDTIAEAAALLDDHIAAANAPTSVPVAAQPRYIFDKDAILEMVERYGEAERDAADSFIRPDRKMAARDEADDLLRAIRAALTPVPDVEPVKAADDGEQRWKEAIDWLLNSRHTADPDIQGPFWAYVDGIISRDELDRFGCEDVLKREAERNQSLSVVDDDPIADELLRQGAAPLVDMGYLSLPAEIHRAADEHVAGTGSADPDGGVR